MSGLRHPLFAAFVFLASAGLPAAAHAGDVTVNYDQLGAAPEAYAGPVELRELPPLVKQSIHLHPLTSTAKNLAAMDVPPSLPSEIHLHPPAPKTLAVIVPPAAPPAGIQVPTSITNIDVTFAALPPLPKPPKQITKLATPPTAPTPEPTAAVVAPAVPTTAPTTVASAPAPQPEHHDAPTENNGAVVPANAVLSKTQDLTPEDVVGLDLGPPSKTDNQ